MAHFATGYDGLLQRLAEGNLQLWAQHGLEVCVV
jgi:hypothetical protein